MTKEKVETRPPKRSHLLQHVLHVPFFISSLWWTLSPLRGPKTPTIGLLVSHFEEIPRNNPPTSPDSPPPPRDSFMLKTRNLLPSLPSVQTAEDKALPERTETIKGLSSLAPSIKKEGAEVEINISRTDSLPVWGKLAHYQSRWLELYPQFPELIRKISQDILIAFSDDAPTLLHRPLELHSNNRPSDLLQAVKKLAPELPSYRRSKGHLVTGLLQSPFSGSQARRIIQTIHRSQEVKPISGHNLLLSKWKLFSPSSQLYNHKNGFAR